MTSWPLKRLARALIRGTDKKQAERSSWALQALHTLWLT